MTTPIYIEHSKPFLPHPWHPSVIFASEGWSGHQYWMAETPFPPFAAAPYKDRWELPCIHYSDDDRIWKNIQHNPIADISEEQIVGHGYLSDPHLLIVNGTMECWYRRMTDQDLRTTILRKTSANGEEWSREEVVADTMDKQIVNKLGKEIISPAIVWKDNQYEMYYVDDTFTNLQRGIKLSTSIDGIHWAEAKSIQLSFDTNLEWSVIPWHIDVQFIGGIYYLLVYDVDHNALVLYHSFDGISFTYDRLVLQASHRFMDFYSHKLYRACMISVEDRLRVYFSANNGMASYIGVMQQDEKGEFQLVDCRIGMRKLRYTIHFLWQRIVQFVQRVIHFIDKRIRKL